MTTMTPLKPSAPFSAHSYIQLRTKVRETLLEGQSKIEKAKVEAYWNTGKQIQQHLLQHKERAEYGSYVIQKLADDLDIGRDILYRALKFFQAFPIVATSRQLTWSHYVELSKVPDAKMRGILAGRAEQSGWNSKELASRIQIEVKGDDAKVKTAGAPKTQLIAKLGKPYYYRLVRDEKIHSGKPDLRIDLGFSDYKEALVDGAEHLKAGDIAVSEKIRDGVYRLRKVSDAGEELLFTYYAYIERVIDGDTLFVQVDLGFGQWTRQYLRLRGINCPEIDTVEGKRAKKFVESHLANVPYVLICSSRSDKYDRYLADVFLCEASHVKREAKKPAQSSNVSRDALHASRYLNQELLNHGLAKRMG